VLLRRRHRKNPLILSASATGIIVGLLVSVSTGLAVSMTSASSAQAVDSTSQTIAAKDYDLTRFADPATNRAADPDLLGAPFADLEVTVSQTQGLLSQAVDVSWTGGKLSSTPGSGNGGSNYLQLAQCWGEDPDLPGHPDRTTCQYGAMSTTAATRDSSASCTRRLDPITDEFLAPVLALSPKDFKYTTGITSDFTDHLCNPNLPPRTSIPFTSVGNAGTIASVLVDPTPTSDGAKRLEYENVFGTAFDGTIQRPGLDRVPGGAFQVPISANVGGTTGTSLVGVDLTNNQFYTKFTSNEVPWAGSGADGKGTVKYEIQTAVQTPALGCGAPVTNPTTGQTEPQSCWLVVIPRGNNDAGERVISKSGLTWDAWKHHIAFKLDFKPTAQRCSIGGTEKQVAGSELAAGAIASWQPQLCLGTSGATFVVSSGNDAAAVTKASGTVPSPLALTSRPLQTSGKDPVQYAPVALSGAAISFAIDKYSILGALPDKATPPAYIVQNTSAFTAMNLTPRLIAKLLTNSYWDSLPPGDRTHIGFESGLEPGPNAKSLVSDKDFLLKQVSDEWQYQELFSISLADLLVPIGQSDVAHKLWTYALSDQEGRDFLAGKPDEWGMKVNPFYMTKDNSVSSALTLPAVTFPKADPIATADSNATNPSAGNDSINLLTYRPYTTDFAKGAYLTLRGDGQLLGFWNPTKKVYDKGARSLIGTQKVLAVTNTEAAARYHNVTAALRNPAGQFVAPTAESLTAAAVAMTPTASNASVIGFDFGSAAAAEARGAYPLAMPVYAALNPLQTDASLRASYASFIRYAANNGQIPGVGTGQLPEGYAPIPQSWVDQAMVSASAIEKGISPLSLVAGTTVIPGGGNGVIAPRVMTSTSEDVMAPDPNPSATGAAAGALAGRPTPADPVLGPVAIALPAGLLSGFGAAAAVPLYGRLRRRP
jgi:hypothetical protein